MLPFNQGYVRSFITLPRHFEEEAHNIITGDFNMVFSVSSPRPARTIDLADKVVKNYWSGCQKVIQSTLGTFNVIIIKITSPTGSSQIEYMLLDYRLFHSVFQAFTILFESIIGVVSISVCSFILNPLRSNRLVGHPENSLLGFSASRSSRVSTYFVTTTCHVI